MVENTLKNNSKASIINKNSTFSYKNIFIRKGDLDTLGKNNQLNDIILSFYSEYLVEKEKLASIKNDILILDPAVVVNLYFDDDIEDLYNMLTPLNLISKKIIFLPINDSKDRFNYKSGLHWALLVYFVEQNKFFYVDSTLSTIDNIYIIAKRLVQVLKYDANNISNNKNSIIEITFKDEIELLLMGSQSNSYDCGMFVLMYMEEILNIIVDDYNSKIQNFILCISKRNKSNNCDNKQEYVDLALKLKKRVKESEFLSKRKEMYSLIVSYIKN